MEALKEALRLSIEQCIRDHLDQDVDRDNAIRLAAAEIADAVCRPIQTGGVDAEQQTA